MTTTLLPSTSSGPLSPEHLQELLAANHRAKKIHAAAKVAAFNGWSIAIVAALSLPLALFSLASLLVEASLAFVAYNEFRGRNRLYCFDLSAPRFLGWNQLGLMALMIGYSLWSIGLAMMGPTPYEAELRANPDLNSILGSVGEMYLAVTLLVYGGVILGTMLFQGLNAWYYFTRAKHMQVYLAATPAWIIDLQRTVPGA